LLAVVLIVGGLQLHSLLARAATAPSAPPAAPSGNGGYWIVATSGAVSSFGDGPRMGSAPARLSRPVVGLAPTPSGGGYWLVGADGGIFSFGDATFLGSTGATRLNRPIVGMAATPTGSGYWLVASDGGIFSFGDARFFGSTGAVRLNQPIVGMAATPTGSGYWLVASDGGIFSFGDARFLGSTGARRLNRPIVGMAATPTGSGYWLVASDGGIFSFGDARFFGSTGAVRLNQPIVGMAATSTGRGYWLVAADGGLFSFGEARYQGAATGSPSRVSGVSAQPPRMAAQNAGPPQPVSTTTTTTGKKGTKKATTATTETTTTTAPPPAPDAPPPPPPAAPPAGAFDIGLIGDTGYDADQERQLLAVRAHMASFPLAFVAHDGDLGPTGTCSDSELQSARGVFDGFAAPFIYTPGDNEWADCSQPHERLEALRRTFFSTTQSLGRSRLTVERQPGHGENARWSVGGVYFATINMPGPDGGGVDTGPRSDWLNGTFDAAEAAGSPGVMIIWQDNPFDGSNSQTLASELKRRAGTFGRPVVLVHGDTHSHRLDHPWGDVPNFTRLETFADSQSDHWVRVTVDPADPGVFSFASMEAR
jgi:hypothetical protein